MFTVNYCGREVGSREERSCIIVAYSYVCTQCMGSPDTCKVCNLRFEW